jgi:hypothetical protein
VAQDSLKEHGMSTAEPAWKRETKEKFDRVLAPDEDLLAVTGGLMFGRGNHYFYIGLTQRRLILLDLEGWLSKAFGAVGVRLPQARYSIHRSMVVDAGLEKTASDTTLVLELPVPADRLAFEQAALGAEEVVEEWRTSGEPDVAASAQDWIDSAQALQAFGLTQSAQYALAEARKTEPDAVVAADLAMPPERWQEERKAHQTAGVLMGIVIGVGALATLITVPTGGWSLEFCGEYVLGALAAYVLLRPLFRDPPAGRRDVFARVGTTMLLFAVLLTISRDFELLIGIAGAYGAVILLLTGRPGRARRWIAIGVFIVSVVTAMVAAIAGLGG